MVLLMSPKQIEQESCTCAQINAPEEESWWLYPDDAGSSSARGRNAANLIRDGGGLFCCLVPWSLKQIELESCTCAKIDALGEGNRWL